MTTFSSLCKSFRLGFRRFLIDCSSKKIPQPPHVIVELNCKRIALQAAHKPTRSIEKQMKAITTSRLKADVAARGNAMGVGR